MSDNGAGNGAQEAYWKQLVLCKIVSCYVKRYRDSQAGWINITGIFKAIVSSSTIGAWIIWKEYAIVWAVFLAAAQVLDAVKEYIPQTKNRRSASEFVQTMEAIIIDARFEWFSVYNGEYTANEIMDRWRKLAKLMNETEAKYFPDGLPADSKRQKLAEDDAEAYFLNTYGVGGSDSE